MLAGAQVSFEVAIFSTFFGLLFGVILGMAAGYFGGTTDVIVSRATEIVMALPLLLFAIAFAFTVGSRLNNYTFFGLFTPGVITLTIVISAFSWYYPARIVRAQILSLREKEFVEAARMVGASNYRILGAPAAAPDGHHHRLRDPDGGREHSVRGRPVVPRRRYPAGAAQLGQPDQRGRQLLHRRSRG